METHIEVGAYEAKSGLAFRITNRDEHVADLVPPGAAARRLGSRCGVSHKAMHRSKVSTSRP